MPAARCREAVGRRGLRGPGGPVAEGLGPRRAEPHPAFPAFPACVLSCPGPVTFIISFSAHSNPYEVHRPLTTILQKWILKGLCRALDPVLD